jgi:hypothetical protein
MKASELRIGNLVKTCTPNMKIMIPHIDAQVQAISLFGELSFLHEPTREGFEMPAQHVTGIPLTEEWLLKFGFIRVRDYPVYSKNDLRIELNIAKSEWTADLYIDRTAIQCVHQLQNLYFALTGEELEIKNSQPRLVRESFD